MSGHPLLRLNGDGHERLKVVGTERGAVAPCTGLIRERTTLAGIPPNRRLMLTRRNVIAGRLDRLLVPW